MRSAALRVRGALALALTLVACDGDRGAAPSATPPARPRDFLIGGCAELRAAARCELSASRVVRLYLPEGGDGLAARLDGAPFTLPEPVDVSRGGVLYEITIPEGGARLELARRLEGAAPQALTLELDAPLPAGPIEEARARRASGDLEGARALLAPLLEASTDAVTRARAQSLDARLMIASGHLDEGLGALAAASIAEAELGMLQSASVDRTIRAEFLRSSALRLDEAAAALRASPPSAEAGALAQAAAAYHGALVDRDLGDRRAALEGLARAIDLAVIDQRIARDAREVRAGLLIDLARFDEAEQELDALTREAGEDACRLANLDEHRGWLELHRERPAAARAALERAFAHYAQACPRPDLRASVAVDLALVALAQDDLPRASAHLRDARNATDTPRALVSAYALEVEARLALLRGRASDALSIWSTLEQRAQAAAMPTLVQLAAEGRARSLAALGRRPEAIAALEAAQTELDAEALGVPLGQGRDAFLERRGRGAALLVELLVAEGRLAEASDAARRARRRALLALSRGARAESLSSERRLGFAEALAQHAQARAALSALGADAWAVPEEEAAAFAARVASARARAHAALDAASRVLGVADTPLSPPPAGELLLVVQGAPGAWIGLSTLNGQSRVTRSDAPEPVGALRALLAPLTSELASASALRFLGSGILSAIDIASLELVFDADSGPEPLGARIAILHPLDVPAPPAGRGTGTLLVSDPREDLRAAGRELDTLRATLPGARVLRGAEVTRAALLAALPQARLFFFGGHGEVRGADALESALPLAEGDGLSVSDLLAFEGAPRDVVLVGCDTGRSDARAVAGLGVAQAFVLAGAEHVVGTSRAITDEEGLALSSALAAAIAEEPHRRLNVAAFRRAQQALRARDLNVWTSLRLVVP